MGRLDSVVLISASVRNGGSVPRLALTLRPSAMAALRRPCDRAMPSRRQARADRNASAAGSPNSTNRTTSTTGGTAAASSHRRTAATAIRATSSDVPAVHTRADRGEGDRAGSDVGRHVEGRREARRELGRVVLSAVPVRTDRVDHPAGGEVPGSGRDRLADRQPVRVRRPAQQPALLQQRGPAAAVDRAVHAATTQQRRVRGVDDRIDDLLGRDVPLRPPRSASLQRRRVSAPQPDGPRALDGPARPGSAAPPRWWGRGAAGRADDAAPGRRRAARASAGRPIGG